MHSRLRPTIHFHKLMHFMILWARTFSSLDMRSGYWQVPFKDEDIDRTWFVTRKWIFGFFGFKVLPYGLCNAPSAFQWGRYGLSWVDIRGLPRLFRWLIIFPSSFKQYLEHLQMVLDRLVEADLKLKLGKCSLFQKRVKFLRSIVSGEGIEPDPEKVQAVSEWPLLWTSIQVLWSVMRATRISSWVT